VLPESIEKQALRVTGLGALLVGSVLLARFGKQEKASVAAGQSSES